MTAPKVLGADPSLSSFGLAGDGWTDVIRPRQARRVRESAREFSHARMSFIRERFAEFLPGVDLVVLEGLAMSPKMDTTRQLAWLNWTVRDLCWTRGVPYAVVSPSGLKLYALGKGRRSTKERIADEAEGHTAKDPVLAAVQEWLGRDVATSDEADAAVLYAMGRDWLGVPVVGRTAVQRAALSGVAWPELPSDGLNLGQVAA